MATATRKPVSATITESLSSSAKVDREAGVIRGVKLIGFDSKNGRTYPPAVLKSAVHLYEGSKVNIDHPERDPAQPRKYGERFGVIRNVHFVEGQGNFGDFHFNPKHPLAEQVCWDAENNPEAMGFSHNALLRVGQPKAGKEVIEQIVSIRSMDLVADPATTKSLFESEGYPMDQTNPAAPAATDPAEAIKSAFKQMIFAAIDDPALDMKATMSKIKEIMKAQEKLMGGSASGSADSGEGEPSEEQYRQQVALLTEQLNQFKAKEALAQRTEAIGKELIAAGLDPKNSRHVSELFSKQLMATESVEARTALIKDRAALLGVAAKTEGQAPATTPVYQPQTTSTMEQLDAKSFARSILS